MKSKHTSLDDPSSTTVLSQLLAFSITMGTWTKHNDAIGNPTPPNGVSESDFVGAEKEFRYVLKFVDLFERFQ